MGPALDALMLYSPPFAYQFWQIFSLKIFSKGSKRYISNYLFIFCAKFENITLFYELVHLRHFFFNILIVIKGRIGQKQKRESQRDIQSDLLYTESEIHTSSWTWESDPQSPSRAVSGDPSASGVSKSMRSNDATCNVPEQPANLPSCMLCYIKHPYLLALIAKQNAILANDLCGSLISTKYSFMRFNRVWCWINHQIHAVFVVYKCVYNTCS